ncbi:MAG: type I-E CRISPR-associated protein Cse2/CasB [Chitinispirillaceae bacterium]|nr:type I-E CRISPR-associated protein Cse2/CasB [Chitinispirillaceae bacterium]
MNDSKRDAFFIFLHSCAERDDRATLANLRCVLRKNLKHRAWPLLARFGGIEDELKEYDHAAKVVQTIAGLFATYPTKSDHDFGISCKKLLSDEERNDMYDREAFKKVGPVARRFQHLLSSEKEEICDRVVRMVLRLKAQEIQINYYELFNGLTYWGDKIKNRWAGSFWDVKQLEEAAL